MGKQIHLGVFEATSPQIGGTLSWSHPRSDTARFFDLEVWIGIAQVLDRSGFDFLFFADSYGYAMLDGDVAYEGVHSGINFPHAEPLVMIPALARATERLGFVVTSATGLDHPVQTARSFASVDHFSGGRIGWNVVTGSSQDAVAALFGHETMRAHDDRYDVADEYIDLALSLWEGSWEDDALVMDRESGVYADRSKLHRIDFDGTHYRSHGYFTVPPSPQRTPLLFQAGTSARGRAFAARNAECVFVQGTTLEQTAANVADIRARAAELGRDPESIRVLVGMTPTVAPTSEGAAALRAEFDDMQTDEVVAALYSGNTGINLLALDRDRSLEQLFDGSRGDLGAIGQMGQSNIERFLPKDGTPAPTVAQILDELRGRGTRGFQVTGSPTEVADRLEELMDVCDLDGFLVEPIFAPTDLVDFAELVVPELRRRGRMPASAASGTLREQVTGGGPRLRDDHRGTRFRAQPTAV